MIAVTIHGHVTMTTKLTMTTKAFFQKFFVIFVVFVIIVKAS
jgi:hypothetical protein